MKTKIVKRKIGANRGNPRLWLEGKSLEAFGWTSGSAFSASLKKGSLVYSKTRGSSGNSSANRKVAGSPGRPIIDTCGSHLESTCGFQTGDQVLVSISAQSIVVMPSKD